MSFTDLMTSYRGPGLIGMVMALFVFLGFSILFLFVFDEELQGGGRSITSVVARQAVDIENLKVSRARAGRQLEEAAGRIADEKALAGLRRRSPWIIEKVAKLQRDVGAEQAEVATRTQIFEAYKDRYRKFVRGKAKGEILEKLETAAGQIYNNVNIREVTSVGIQIRHDGGLTRIPYEQLPAPLKIRFQFDPKQKQEALASEWAASQNLEAEVAVTNILLDHEAEKRRLDEAEMLRNKILSTIQWKESQISSLGNAIRQLELDIIQEQKKTLSKAANLRGEVASKLQIIAGLRSQVAALRGRL